MEQTTGTDGPGADAGARRAATADLLADAAARAIRYVTDDPGRPIFPTPDAIAALSRFDAELPEHGIEPRLVLAQLDELGSAATVRTTEGRYFGFVTGGVEPSALAASVLAAAWDQNVALPVMSPIGARLDTIAADWVCRLLALPRSAVAAFCSGASVANLTCLTAARDALMARAGWDVAADGLAGAPPIEVVTSAEVHVSVLKALRAIGIGRRAVTLIPTDDCGRIDVDAMPPIGQRALVIAQAGNVNTGHSDPFDAIGDRLDESSWLHVDGAFGLWAAASEDHRHLVTGADRADSWATDAHKWLNVPYDSGVAICARAEDLERAMAIDAAYVASDDDRAPMRLGLQMSQRARGIETWAVLATRGRSGVADIIATSCELAARLAGRLAAAGAEVLAPVVLNQALVAFGDDTTTDAVIDTVQRDGTCWVGGTRWHGRRAMRISVSDSSTTIDDVDAAARAILDAVSGVARRPSP